MNSTLATISVETIDFHVLPMETRFPFQYGIASMSALPHLFVTARVVVDGKAAIGMASEGLPPKWFTKDPTTTFEEDLPQMLEVIRNAARIAQINCPGQSYFDWWLQLYDNQKSWALSKQVPPLLANLGVSLMERAVIDAVCRSRETPFSQIIQSNALGIRLSAVYPELGDRDPVDFLPDNPSPSVIVRHTVGLGDPLTLEEVKQPLDDGLPYSLEDCITSYGLSHFKVKLCGKLQKDRERLYQLSLILEKEAVGNYYLTLDGNEQFGDIAEFRDHWNSHGSNYEIRTLFKHLLFVEQPVHRNHALRGDIREALAEWKAAPPLIIDESDSEVGSLPTALNLGYAGTSHKNCKGIVKGIANACLLEHHRRLIPANQFILSGEDLANVGPIALLQDLTVMATLGVGHVERNGHHYFKGLSMLPAEMQQQVLADHGDLYRLHQAGYPTLRIENGQVNFRSLLDSSFGVAGLVDVGSLATLKEWSAGH